jgi:excisionase family DNA binding protein
MALDPNNLDLVSEGLLRITETEKLTGMSRATLYRMMESGELPYVQLGKKRRIPRRALAELLAKHLVVA